MMQSGLVWPPPSRKAGEQGRQGVRRQGEMHKHDAKQACVAAAVEESCRSMCFVLCSLFRPLVRGNLHFVQVIPLFLRQPI